MRITARVTSVSWIPSEAIPGTMKLPMLLGIAHYDDPPPAELDDVAAWWAAGRFRFANEHTAWIEVDDEGRVTAADYAGRGWVSETRLQLGRRTVGIPPVVFPELRAEPEHGEGWVRFVQTVGGRTGAPMPRAVDRAPFVQVTSPSVWTTLALTVHTDGRVDHEVVGASPFPRHWIYDGEGRLVAKSGLADYRAWAGDSFGEHTPWEGHDEQALITGAETARERMLATTIMRGGARPGIQRLETGRTLTEQGQPGRDLYLLLDGMLAVEVDGEAVAEVGPGAILGERAILEAGRRTATLRALTPCRVAVARGVDLDPEVLAEIAVGHRREEQAGSGLPDPMPLG